MNIACPTCKEQIFPIIHPTSNVLCFCVAISQIKLEDKLIRLKFHLSSHHKNELQNIRNLRKKYKCHMSHQNDQDYKDIYVNIFHVYFILN